MQFSRSLFSAVILAVSSLTLAHALPKADTSSALEERAATAAGFLSATFLGNVPHVFLHYSKANAPVSFSAVSGSKGELVPTLGTKGARDPFIFQNRVNGKFYILATDLDISKTNWGDAQARGSRSIHVWESSDGVNWSTERLVQLMDATAGYVWAPSATWDAAANAYAVFWASQTYASSDTGHTGTAQGPFIYYSHTTDMINFTAPKRWDSANFGGKVIDQEIMDLGNGNMVRWYVDVKNNNGVVMDKTSQGLFGTWQRVGKPANVVWEGPAIQRDIANPSKFYLWEDNYGGPGYSCFQTEDIYKIPYAACDPALSPTGMRHGAVVQRSFSARHPQPTTTPTRRHPLTALSSRLYDHPDLVAGSIATSGPSRQSSPRPVLKSRKLSAHAFIKLVSAASLRLKQLNAPSRSVTTMASSSASTAASAASAATADDIAPARRFLEYVDASPTPFHAVATTSAMLDAAGFVRIKENELWDNKVKQGGKYYFTRNQSAIVAFAVGAKYQPGNGVHVVGAHTDSPNFQIKPVSRKAKEGYLQCGVETYGGGIWASWFDRDLGLAGRVIVSDSKSHDAFTGKLVHIKRPILRIPTLAIHLNRTVNEAFKFNVEDNTVPILGLATEHLNKRADEAAEAAKLTPQAVGSPVMAEKHHSVLLDLLAEELGISVEQIQDFELSLYDTQPASIGGINNEFIHSPRLDNQMSCFCATEALIDSLSSADSLNASSSIRAIALFDNEEVGSVSTHGAESNMLPSLIQRLVALPVSSSASSPPAASNLYEQAIARSFLLSSDMAHGFHPNYPSFYEENHRPKINQGPVIKTNVKQRYATTGPTAFLVRRIAQRAQVPLQSFVVKNDMPCGSTIGPMLSKLGIRTLDLGNPQLSMHSIRETCGTKDVGYKIQLFKHFFDSFEEVDAQLVID